MPTVAEQLRQARLARNLTLQQVAEVTKLRTDHLLALEEGNYDVFSAPVYARGSVRSYATLLKLDVPQIMAALEAELGQAGKLGEPLHFAEKERNLVDFVMLQLTKLDWRKGLVVLVAALLLIVIAVSLSVSRHQRTSDPLKNLKPGLYQGTQGVSGDTLPLPPAKR